MSGRPSQPSRGAAVRPRWRALAAALLAAALPAAGAGPASGPITGQVDLDKTFREVDRCFDQIEQLRVAGGTNAEAVATVAKYGQAILSEAERALAAQVDSAEQAEAAAAEGRGAPPRPLPSRLLRIQRCRALLATCELCTRAAQALPAAHADRAAYLNKAIETCRWLRIEFRDLPIGMMGYVGEGKARRLLGQAAAALEALQAVGRPALPSAGEAMWQLHLAASLERLYARDLTDPKGAIEEATKWLASPELATRRQWRAKAEWALAQFLVGLLAKLPRGSAEFAERVAHAAGLLRRASVVEAAGRFDSLALLQRLDDLAGGKCMTTPERLEWAKTLHAAGRMEAVEVYARLWALPGRPIPAEAMLAYASLLWHKTDATGVADVCDEFIRRFAPLHPRLATAIELRAAALLKAVEGYEAGAVPPAVNERLTGALETLIESKAPPDARSEALRQWVALQAQAERPYGEMLVRHRPLVEADAYLLYMDAARQWEALREQLAPGAQAGEREIQAARAIADKLARASKLAAGSDMGALEARAALLGARLLASRPVSDARAALGVLEAQAACLKAEASTAAPAAWFRVELMMELGMLDAATAALGELSGDGSAGPRDVSLRLAELLAERYSSVDLLQAGKVQQRVLDLCSRAMRGAVADEKRYAQVALRVGRTMLKVQAYVDAELFLKRIVKDKRTAGDQSVELGCSLVLAETLQQSGKMDDALSLLEGLTESFPASTEALLALGRCELKVRRPQRAVEAFRRARKLCRPGGADWCRMTLALGEGLRAAGHETAAEDVLRVSQVLYPSFGGAELRAKLLRMRDSLAKGAGKTPPAP